MPNGRGRGRGLFWRGFAPWGLGSYGYGGYSAYGYPYFMGGRGNPLGFCRNFPWLPRWWWAMPNAGQYAGTIPFAAGYPSAQTYAWPWGATYSPGGVPVPGQQTGGV